MAIIITARPIIAEDPLAYFTAQPANRVPPEKPLRPLSPIEQMYAYFDVE